MYLELYLKGTVLICDIERSMKKKKIPFWRFSVFRLINYFTNYFYFNL